jgi:CubicO group peptidase (beta-lactamase class C family)
VTKLFTWTAVMQLVEQGKLNLDADVNTYLKDFKIPQTCPEPVTLAHLLTHTAGFEDQVIGLFARSAEAMIPLGRLLAREMPKRVRPPGVLAAYSNHGTALAGYIVEQVTGTPWEAYVEKNILQPLDMKHTTVRQPIPPELAADMATGYKYADGEFLERGFEFVPASAAGAMSASAVDMAHFMIAHLQLGKYGANRILSEETARKMHNRLFSHLPQLNGMLHGFYEMNRNGLRVFGHGGSTFLFHTQLMLIPEQNVGLFVSYNSDSGSAARTDLAKLFLDHYWPAHEAATPKAPADFAQRASRFAGDYASIRMSYTTGAKIVRLFMTIRTAPTREGYLASSGLGRERKRWVEIAPLLFREVDGQELMAFREDERGRITHVFFSSFPPIAFAKLSTAESSTFHHAWLAVTLIILLSAFIAWPIGAWRRRHEPRSTGPFLARIVGWVFCGLCIVFSIGMMTVLSDPFEMAFGVSASFKSLLLLPLLAAVLAIAMVVFALLAWWKEYWRLRGRIYYSLVTLAGVAFLWWLNYWNLPGYHLR